MLSNQFSRHQLFHLGTQMWDFFSLIFSCFLSFYLIMILQASQHRVCCKHVTACTSVVRHRGPLSIFPQWDAGQKQQAFYLTEKHLFQILRDTFFPHDSAFQRTVEQLSFPEPNMPLHVLNESLSLLFIHFFCNNAAFLCHTLLLCGSDVQLLSQPCLHLASIGLGTCVIKSSQIKYLYSHCI